MLLAVAEAVGDGGRSEQRVGHELEMRSLIRASWFPAGLDGCLDVAATRQKLPGVVQQDRERTTGCPRCEDKNLENATAEAKLARRLSRRRQERAARRSRLCAQFDLARSRAPGSSRSIAARQVPSLLLVPSSTVQLSQLVRTFTIGQLVPEADERSPPGCQHSPLVTSGLSGSREVPIFDRPGIYGNRSI